MKTIDLNCDMGESYGAWKMGADAEVMPYISSANIACGFHAGDPMVMQRMVSAATGRGVWATHFVAMLAFRPDLPAAYEPLLTGLSLFIAMAVTGFGFAIGPTPYRCPASR